MALDPNPAATNEAVTHPHVNDETVCEGDGQARIRRALGEGRLFDFFVMVDRILHTYAPGRAFVELDQWYGRSCHDCGYSMDEDEPLHLRRVRRADLPGLLQLLYRTVTESAAPAAETSCARCDDICCTDCLTTCQICRKRVCSDCLHETLLYHLP